MYTLMPKNTCDLAGKDEREYLDILADTIVDMYGCTEKDARAAIRNSRMLKLFEQEQEHEYERHVPISSWAESIWAGKLSKRFGR